MNIKFIKSPEFYLILISFTFLAMWISNIISFFYSSDILYLISKYLFSLIIPTIGLILYLNYIRTRSSTWYLGLPLFIGMILISFLRDGAILYGEIPFSLIRQYDTSHLLDQNSVVRSIEIFFALSSLSFALSVPKDTKRKMYVPIRISAFTVACITIATIIQLIVKQYQNYAAYLWFSNVLGLLFFGLSLIWIAVNYEKENEGGNVNK
ncbi:hypothetical protein [uncultured Methanomethylovorans sp.]|uniref:hypothetical protein n=1 Tax=uncultured Methanomethylovorans sp. TaxID=183759 RepID=UPI002AA8DB87|nr:hypothetical protein [uncultured Methanomethylovorans sp.]